MKLKTKSKYTLITRLKERSIVLGYAFFFLYAIIIWLFSVDNLQLDEFRYLQFASNLLEGYYSPPHRLNLWNGPGYPILLSVLLFVKTPISLLPYFNAIFQAISVVYLTKTVSRLSTKRMALFAGLFWGFYYPVFQEIILIFTEPLSSMLISIITYLLVKGREKYTRIYIPLGLFFGYLVLTKVIFGYVLLTISAILLPCCIVQWKRFGGYGKSILVAWLLVLPYLIYTYSITDRVFYLSNAGGTTLYWMSTPHHSEYGDWYGLCYGSNVENIQLDQVDSLSFEFLHYDDVVQLNKVQGLERDDLFKKIALQNICNHPLKYLQNCLYNQGRLWFGFPFSYRYQEPKTLIRIPPGAALLALFVFGVGVACLRFRRNPIYINAILIVLLIYLGGTTLLSAYNRQLYIMTPMIISLFVYARTTYLSKD